MVLIELIKDIWIFKGKKNWLAPLIITIVLMGTLIIFTQPAALHLYIVFLMRNLKF